MSGLRFETLEMLLNFYKQWAGVDCERNFKWRMQLIRQVTWQENIKKKYQGEAHWHMVKPRGFLYRLQRLEKYFPSKTRAKT